MTLLNENNLATISARIPLLGRRYQELTGKSLYEICCHAAHTETIPEGKRRAIKVASVPVTAGGGLIGNFAELVASIVHEFTGAEAYQTEATDVAGFQEAVLSGADIVFCADDDACIAYNTRTGSISDNGYATGYAFAALLELASGKIDEAVLILGGGKVGVGAYRYLSERGYRVCWYDSNPNLSTELPQALRCPNWSESEWRFIIDATTAPTFIDAAQVTPESVIAAPGIPFGLTEDAVKKARTVIHDELESGVVTMFCEATSSW